MSGAPGAPARGLRILVAARAPGALAQLRRGLEGEAGRGVEAAARLLATDPFHPDQATSSSALTAAVERVGADERLVVLLFADVATTMRAEDLALLRRRSPTGIGDLWVIGIAPAGSTDLGAFSGLVSTGSILESPTPSMVALAGALRSAKSEAEQASTAEDRRRLAEDTLTIRVSGRGDNGLLGKSAGVILIAGPKGGAGKTTITTSLAFMLAAAGRRVAIIDANPTMSYVHYHFRDRLGREISDIDDLLKQRGLTHVLNRSRLNAGRFSIDEPTLRDWGMIPLRGENDDGFVLIPGLSHQYDLRREGSAGGVGPAQTDDRWLPQVIEYLRKGVRAYDYVIIDSGNTSNDGFFLGAARSADIVVWAVNGSSKLHLEASVRNLQPFWEGGAGSAFEVHSIPHVLVVNDVHEGSRVGERELRERFAFMSPRKVILLPHDCLSARIAGDRERPILDTPELRSMPDPRTKVKGPTPLYVALTNLVGDLTGVVDGVERKSGIKRLWSR